MAINLSVNINKVATLRNARGGSEPGVLEAVETCIAAGAPGITVHPRQDERHIRRADVYEVASRIAAHARAGRHVEFNIEGDPRPDFVEMVTGLRPTQCTLVPVMPGEVTSQAGWKIDAPAAAIAATVARLRDAGVRVSVFVDPEEAAVRWAASVGADRVELYTEPFARAFAAGEAAGRASFARYERAAAVAHQLGLGLNAGHDLNLKNLTLFRTLPHLDEVSIGHALISHALWVGLDRSVRDYLAAVAL